MTKVYWKTDPSWESGTRSVASAPYSIVIDRDGLHFRSAQVRAVNGSAVTMRLYLEAFQIGDRVTDASTFEGHTPAVGNPCYCKVDPSNNYQILAVYPSGPADHAAELAWDRDRTTFNFGFIAPRHFGN